MAEKWQINKTHIASVYENGIRWLMLQEQKKEESPKKKKNQITYNAINNQTNATNNT